MALLKITAFHSLPLIDEIVFLLIVFMHTISILVYSENIAMSKKNQKLEKYFQIRSFSLGSVKSYC
jgi:biopolymer transport protein ExbD